MTPITPVMLGEAPLAKEFSRKLFDDGVFAMAIGFPTVPRGKARIRVMISASHNAYADNGINFDFQVRIPPSSWDDQSCGAWTTGGDTGSGGTDYAGIGLELSNGNPYDLSAYTGVRTWLESGDSVWLVVKTADGGYFGAPMAATSGNEARTLDFSILTEMDNSMTSTLDLTQVLDLQYNAEDPTSFGYVIHNVSVY